MNDTETSRLLVIGIGNTGRRDDGLGWCFLDILRELPDFQGHIEYRYQLQIEDAELISKFKKVIFVDASKDDFEMGFSYAPLEKKHFTSFTTHAIPPAHILSLCSDLYDYEPEAYQLAISGCEWGLKLELSVQAKENLEKAYKDFIRNMNIGLRFNPSNVEC